MNDVSLVAKQRRQQQLQAWVCTCLGSRLPAHQSLQLHPISGDAGFRSYYRVSGMVPASLAVDAPPATEKNQAFCHVARLLRQYGIHAPQVFAVDYEQGFLLLEDLGDVMYWPQLLQSQRNGDARHQLLYEDATRCLQAMAAIPATESGLPIYDAENLQQEMNLFPQWFVQCLLKVDITPADVEMLLDVNKKLITSALEQPQVVVHRDFHSRNLMVTNNKNPGVIDFQDAVLGPVTYDLVSLYRDCYIRWPTSRIEQWVQTYYQQCVLAGIVGNIGGDKFLRWFDWMGLQRHIKVLGIFARLYLRDHKTGYLKDLPLVIYYTLSVAKKYPEFSRFVNWFERELLPSARNFDWYQELA
jgi:aminoglycoside/choline kinase family phosphotransferase